MQRLSLSSTVKYGRPRVLHPRAPRGIRWHRFAFLEPPTTPPLFQRVPPWWARWTWALIACDIFLTGSAIELTWNNWYKLVEDLSTPPGTSDKKGSTSAEAQSTATKKWEPRPTWQRAGLCFSHLALGVGCAVALLVTQTRFVRTFAILPPLPASTIQAIFPPRPSTGFLKRAPNLDVTPKPESRVFIQCAHNWRKNGEFVPISYCSLEQGRDASELILRIKDKRGHWHLALEDSIIYGEDVGRNTGKAQQAILGAWNWKKRGEFTGITKAGQNVALDKRWKSGPVKAGA